MNGPTAAFWLQFAGWLALEVAGLVLLAAVGHALLRSALWRRALWQASLVALAGLLTCELTGAAGGAVGWLRVALERPQAARPSGLADRMEVLTVAVPAVEIAPQPLLEPRPMPPAPSPTWWPAMVWLGGGVCLLGYALTTRLIFTLGRRRRRAVTNAAVLARVAALAERLRLKAKVRVWEAAPLEGPVSCGLIRRTIGLPLRFGQDFSPAQQDAMLAHELAHLAAHDPAWHALADTVVALLWWHPLVWWARRQWRITSETAADEAALLVEEGPQALAECLVALGGRLVAAHRPGWLGIGGSGFRSGLGRRVERLMGLGARPWRPMSRWQRWAVGMLGPLWLIGLVMAGSVWAQPRLRAGHDWRQSWDESPAGRALVALAKPADAKQTPAESVQAKLQSLKLKNFFIRMPVSLGEALRVISDESRQQDPDRRGIDFFFDPDQPAPAAGRGLARTNRNDVRAVEVTCWPHFQGAPVAELLDTVVFFASAPIRYRVEDRGVIFSLEPDAPALQTLGVVADSLLGDALGKTNKPAAAVREYLASHGLKLEPSRIRDRFGGLVELHLTSDEMRQYVQISRAPRPPHLQVEIKMRFCEVNRAAGKPFDLKALLGGRFTHFVPPASRAGMSDGSRVTTAGVLRPGELRSTLVHLLERSDAYDLALPRSATTLDGRRVELTMLDRQNVITGLRLATNGIARGGIRPEIPGVPPRFWPSEGPEIVGEVIEVGPSVVVVPMVLADEKTISMVVRVMDKQFGGYDDPQGFEAALGVGPSRPSEAYPARPRFRLRQLAATAEVRSGRTLVLYGGTCLETREIKDFLPRKANPGPGEAIGNGERIGEYGPPAHPPGSDLLVFITPTLIDRAGNRIPPEEEPK